VTGSGRAVIGRAWMTCTVLPVVAHSMSCGQPNSRSSRRAVSATATACAGVRTSARPGVVALPPVTRHDSPPASPPTSESANPATAVITEMSRFPINGSAVNATPAACAATMACTSTATPLSVSLAR
jgi:hypothetical protein